MNETTSDRSLNAAAEWALGVTEWLEAGVYLPLLSVSRGRGVTFDGGKLRLLFTEPHVGERKLFCAMNLEASFNASHWDQRRFTSEMRPIIGTHQGPLDIIVNPILDSSYVGGILGLDFAPAVRVAYNLSRAWTIAAEAYADLGRLRRFDSISRQSHQLWAVFDHNAGSMHIEAGIGFGLTRASDAVTIKLMLSRDLYDHEARR